MNDETKIAKAEKPKAAKSYYTSKFAGLTVMAGEKSARFMPYLERVNGDPVKVGYLSTSDNGIKKVCDSDANIVAISKEDFSKATGDDSFPIGY